MKHDKFLLKSYENWNLYLHQSQYPYLGRCYVWATREDCNKVTDMSLKETKELFEKIIPEWNAAIKKLYNYDWPNTSCLGNTTPHCHWHLIPRYHKTITHHNIEFIDPKPTKNYVPFENKELANEVIIKIRDEVKSTL